MRTGFQMWMKKIKNMLATRMAKNTGWLIVAKIYQVVVNLAVSILTARYLGPANYGLINYAASLTALFTAFCTLGINSILVNELINHKEEQGRILGSAIGLRMLSSGLSVVMIILLTTILNPHEPITIAVVAIYSTTLVLQSFDTLNYWYQSTLQNKVTAIISAVRNTVASVKRIDLLITRQNVLWFAASHVVEFFFVAILLVLTYNRRIGKLQRLCFDWTTGKKLVGKGYHFILSGMMVAIYGQMDRIMLKSMLGNNAVGFYSAAAAIISMWPFVLSALIDSAKPIILAKFNTDRVLFERYLTWLYGAIIYISFAVAIAITLFSKYVILILYGEVYVAARGALCILCWDTAFSYLGVARSIWLVPQEKQKYEKFIALSGAVCNLVLNALLIPVWGINGAAFATLSTQVFTNFVVGFFFKDVRRNNILILRSFRILRCMK